MSIRDEMNRVFSTKKDAFLTALGWIEAKGVEVEVTAALKQGEAGAQDDVVKKAMFPQPEPLFSFTLSPRDPDANSLKEVKETRRRIIAGVRPCDARSIQLNSLPYEEDSYFVNRMENTVVVGLLCTEELSTCFCTRVGGSPMGTDGMDVAALLDEDGVLFLKCITQKGKAFVDEDLTRSGLELRPVGGVKGPFQKMEQVEEGMGLSGTLRKKDLMTLYNAPFWDRLKDACVNCGICTFLCPTCYCFDIQDETIGPKGRRIRYWDSCMFPLFTLHASGHNPRGAKVMRVRNRFMHKLKYFPDRFGPISCVGCGRCVRMCPVNIDIREVIDWMEGV